MKLYDYIKLATSARIPGRIKLLGLWCLMLSHRRVIGIFFDPVMACNFRCKMCYMSNPKLRENIKGQVVEPSRLNAMKKALYHRALKLQIGCATEPTIYPNLPELITDAKKAGIPYISLTTNGKLIATGHVGLRSLVEAGLSELTLSLHGTTAEIYEQLMPGGKFEDLKALTQQIAEVKREFPEFKLRVNYTINSLNIHDLEEDKFWSLWASGGQPDIIQLRPVQDMGDTVWTDFDLTPLKEFYDTTIGAIIIRCKQLGISCIAPTREQIDEVATDQDFTSAVIKDITYCYVSPDTTYKPDFAVNDTFESYHRRSKTAGRLLKSVFSFKHKSQKRDSTKHLNYRVS